MPENPQVYKANDSVADVALIHCAQCAQGKMAWVVKTNNDKLAARLDLS